MLKTYFKIALKTLARNKLYTAISLFGISFTLLVLMLAAAILENEIGNRPPLSKRDRILFVPSLYGEGYKRETVTTYDSVMVDGKLRVDTIRTTKVLEGNITTSMSSYLALPLYREKIRPMKTPELTSVFVNNVTMNVYPNGEKLVFRGLMTDAGYWKIFDFRFLEGGPFDEASVENQANFIILRESAAAEYFGKSDSYLGKEVIWGLKGRFKVTGVVRDFGTTNRFVNSDFFIPLTWGSPEDLNRDMGYFGNCAIALLAKDVQGMNDIGEELRVVESGLEKKDRLDRFRILEKDAADVYAWNFIGSQLSRDGKNFLAIAFGLLGLFLLIPVINLVNLNVTRVYDRSSEIGARKAFGARTADLLLQFLFENLIITFIGGAIGLALTLLVLWALNQSHAFGKNHLSFHFSLLMVSIGITFVFGVVSGLLPAWRIARTPVIKALKSGNL